MEPGLPVSWRPPTSGCLSARSSRSPRRRPRRGRSRCSDACVTVRAAPRRRPSCARWRASGTPRHQPGRHRVRTTRRADQRADGRPRHGPGVAHVPDGRRSGAAHRLRQRRQPAADARRRALARTGDQDRTRCQPRAPGSPAAGRRPGPGGGRRRRSAWGSRCSASGPVARRSGGRPVSRRPAAGRPSDEPCCCSPHLAAWCCSGSRRPCTSRTSEPTTCWRRRRPHGDAARGAAGGSPRCSPWSSR